MQLNKQNPAIHGGSIKYKFSLTTRHVLENAWLSKAAYGDPVPDEWTKDSRIIPIDNNASDTHALAIINPGYNVMAYRGTKGRKNLFTDLNLRQCRQIGALRHIKGEGFHMGFTEAWESIMDEVMQIIQETPHNPWIFTGHSLGGALAEEGAFYIDHFLPGVLSEMITFGTPRWCNPKVAHAYNKRFGNKSWRIRNQDDGIPKVPAITWGGIYRHTKNTALLDSFGKLDVNPHWLYTDWSDIHGFYMDLISRRRFSDLYEHSIDRYIADIQIYEQQQQRVAEGIR